MNLRWTERKALSAKGRRRRYPARMAPSSATALDRALSRPYPAGFETDVASLAFPPGLDEAAGVGPVRP